MAANRVRLAATALTLGLAALTSTGASASTYVNRPASGACKAAFGAGASVFYFDAEGAQNTSASTQYLTCSLGDVNSAADSISSVSLHFQNPNATAATVTCVIVLAHPGTTRTVASYSINVPANTGTGHYYNQFTSSSTPAIPTRSSSDDGYTMSCAIPAGVKFNTITTESPKSLT